MLEPGTLLAGRYEVRSVLGAGGMGEVYRATDRRLRRDVAVKVLPERLSHDTRARARFEREAQALAALAHPGILAVHDSGAEGGHAFVVTELLEGETLRDRLRQGHLPWAKAAELGARVAEALAAAHGRGVVHRDLKPENLFLTADGGVRVLDFGLALVTEPDAAPADVSTARTEPGTVLGTVPYMAPEQVRGLPADARSDIFALGCVLHEAITGRSTFARATSADTIAAILGAEPEDLAATDPALPPALALTVRRALEKSAEARFQSARDLAFALRMGSTASGALPPAAPAPPRPRWRRPLVLGAALALAGLAGSGILALRNRPAPVRTVAVLPLASGGGGELDFLADGIAEAVIQSLSRLSGVRVMARSTVFRYRGAGVEPRQVGRELRADAVLTGSVAERGGKVRVAAELVDVATGSRLWGEGYEGRLEDLLGTQRAIAREVIRALRLDPAPARRDEIDRSGTRDAEAYRLCLKGRLQAGKRTEEGFLSAVDLFRQALERDPAYALAWVGLAETSALAAAYGYVPADEGMPRARAAAERSLQIDEGLAEAHATLALVALLHDWRFAESERRFRRATELAPGYATAHHWYAEFLMAMGRSGEALAELSHARQLDPLSSIIAADEGRALSFARRHAEAAARFRGVLASDPGFQPARAYLAATLEDLGRFEEARAELLLLPPPSVDRGSRLALAHLDARSGRRAEAEAALRALLEQPAGAPPYAVAELQASLGRDEEALLSLERAVEERAPAIVYLAVQPRFDRLRENPGFVALLRRLGLDRVPRPRG